MVQFGLKVQKIRALLSFFRFHCTLKFIYVFCFRETVPFNPFGLSSTVDVWAKYTAT
jgi:hypothetical protein